MQKTINDLLDLEIELKEIHTLLEINSEVYFSNIIDPQDFKNLNTLQLVFSYDSYSLLNHIALTKVRDVLAEINKIEKEYNKVQCNNWFTIIALRDR